MINNCSHKKLSLKVLDTFEMYEKTEVICANCGIPIKKINAKQHKIALFKIVIKAVSIAIISFYISFKIVNYILPLIIK